MKYYSKLEFNLKIIISLGTNSVFFEGMVQALYSLTQGITYRNLYPVGNAGEKIS